jgi:hypothetical protein
MTPTDFTAWLAEMKRNKQMTRHTNQNQTRYTFQAQRDGKTFLWHSVETPSVFREVELPAEPTLDNIREGRDRETLEALAEAHGTHINTSHYRRG